MTSDRKQIETGSRIVLSKFQTRSFIRAQNTECRQIEESTDLGLTKTGVEIGNEGVTFSTGEFLGWDAVKKIDSSENGCFLIEQGNPRKIQIFSELTNRTYSLMPTENAPTMLVSGLTMHRIKGTEPYRDTRKKIKSIAPVFGKVLDTTTGLGYTAIEAAKTAAHVTTVELDPAALEIAGLNPWSAALFDNPKITGQIGDSFDVVEEFEDNAFTRIIHDPPAFSMGGDLYSGKFYAKLFRILRPGGRLFHYIGNPKSRSVGSITRGVMKRLKEAGFSKVKQSAAAFGVVCAK